MPDASMVWDVLSELRVLKYEVGPFDPMPIPEYSIVISSERGSFEWFIFVLELLI
mgnify:CR=1 FL=1